MHLGSSNVCVTGLSKKLRMEYTPPPPEVSKYSGKALKKKENARELYSICKENFKSKFIFLGRGATFILCRFFCPWVCGRKNLVYEMAA